MSTAYSKTPLAKKLGIKEGYIIRIINAPDYYATLFSDFPEQVTIVTGKKQKKDFIHFFTKHAEDLRKNLLQFRSEIFPGGMIWVSWPKKASKVETDITEDVVRVLALNNGLVDIKVCAIDEIWSGLKLVIPLKDR
ncbi:MAG: DUF3052 family protein [Chitinophagaceae bacterium]|nr:DUF3052 family protein [Chitinophagaceae bacterium]